MTVYEIIGKQISSLLDFLRSESRTFQVVKAISHLGVLLTMLALVTKT